MAVAGERVHSMSRLNTQIKQLGFCWYINLYVGYCQSFCGFILPSPVGNFMENHHQVIELNASLHRLSPEGSGYSFLRAPEKIPGVGYLKWMHEQLLRYSDIKR